MKQNKLLKHLLAVLLLALLPQAATAYDFMVDGLCYNKNSGGTSVTVTYQKYSSLGLPFYSNLSGNLVIPATVTYRGTTYSVTSIGDCAFRDCSGLTSVTIPNSVTSIGGYAFCDCSGLTSVTIPNSVTSIGDYAFYGTAWYNNQPDGLVYAGLNAYKYKGNMPSGTVVEIQEGTKGISPSCFRDCSGLTSVTIPNSVTSIGSSAFSGCSGIKKLTWNAINCTSNGDMSTYNIKQVTIGDGVEVLPGGFVSGSKITSVTIPNSVTSIGDEAFKGCSGLTSVTIPNSVTSIGSSAFSGCSGLTSVTIPNSVTSIGYRAFSGCSGLTSVTIPNSVTSIGEWAFSGCSGLTSVTIPNSATSIGEWAFSGCSGLTSVTIPNSATSIGDYAFSGCSGLTSVTWNAKSCADFTSSTTPFSSAKSSIKNFTIGGQVQRIPAYLCYQMTSLTSVTIPNSVTSIGARAFQGCSGIKELTWNAINCSSMGDMPTGSIEQVTIGDGVEVLPGGFVSGSKITTVTIPNSVTSIGSSAFADCSGIKELTWNAINCSSMGDMPTGNIEQVTIGDGVEVLPGSFVSGSKITSVTIPNSVTSIGSSAFADCSVLLVFSKIVEPEGVQLGDNVFAGIPFATCILNVPSGSIASYQSADQWKDFLMIVDFSYDVNLDGTIDIADVNAVVNKMLERNGAPTKELADVNRDDYVDIIDVNEVISAMLGYGNLPEPPCATQTYTVNGVSFTMIGVQGGTFTMGATAEQGSDAFDSEKPAHQVTLSNYRIGQTEVTQELWQAVMGSNPSRFTGDLQRPVERVSWDDCQTFITKLNQLTGKNFRLPTEAEWEYAARGGNQSQGYKYAGSNNVDEVAWHSGNSSSTTHTVATKAANELGIYDMSGNVLEWCQDWYGSYSSDAQTNPTGPASGTQRIFRGGSYVHTNIGSNRVSWRNADDPTKKYINLGFRLALLPEPPISTQTYTVNGVTFSMIGVNGGTFTMGATAEQGSDAQSNEKPAHQVTLSNYRIGQTEVTQELWQAVMGSNPSRFTGDLQRPVECVSWDDCQTFITKLNQLTGENFRLPTEAEWEYAARGGNQSQGYKYAGSNNINDVAWYYGNSGSTSHSVATKAPNELGLYDMSGNVWEWCQDRYGSYSSDAQTNPTGPTSGSTRVYRGGSWYYSARSCRVSSRYDHAPSHTFNFLGLRLAL